MSLTMNRDIYMRNGLEIIYLNIPPIFSAGDIITLNGLSREIKSIEDAESSWIVELVPLF